MQKKQSKRHKLYNTWQQMKQRCFKSNHHQFKDYGGRGITVCDRWMNFQNFIEDMGERPEGSTLDRIDNDESYGPFNCRWATRKEQRHNSRQKVTGLSKNEYQRLNNQTAERKAYMREYMRNYRK